MARFSIKFFLIGLLVFFCSFPANAQTSIGYVLDFDGTWYLNGDRSNVLKRGAKLPAGGVIRIDSASRSNLLVIANLRGEIIITRTCETESCSRPIKLPENQPPRSFGSAIFDAAMGLIWGSPDRYSAHRSRSEELTDGVVKLSEDKIDFTPVLKKPGRYYLRWRLVPGATEAASRWSDPINVNIERDSLAPAPAFKPGLYEVNLMRQMGNGYEPTGAAWVLVCSSPEYEQFSSSFREATELTKQWGDRVKPEAARLFLQAHLDQLAKQTASDSTP